MGVRHGLYCLGCCWALMLLLFVGGVMNLLWVAVIAAVVFVEKLLARGEWLRRAIGLAALGAAWWSSSAISPADGAAESPSPRDPRHSRTVDPTPLRTTTG